MEYMKPTATLGQSASPRPTAVNAPDRWFPKRPLHRLRYVCEQRALTFCIAVSAEVTGWLGDRAKDDGSSPYVHRLALLVSFRAFQASFDRFDTVTKRLDSIL